MSALPRLRRASAREPFAREKPDDPKQEGHAAGDLEDQAVAHAILSRERVIHRAENPHPLDNRGQAGIVGDRRAGDELPERLGQAVGGVGLAIDLAIDAALGVDHADLQDMVEARRRGDEAEAEVARKIRHDGGRRTEKLPVGLADAVLCRE